MNFAPSEWMLPGALAAFVVWFVLELRRAPTEEFDIEDYARDHDAAQECIDATGPVPLDRPHIKAGTAGGKQL